MSLKSFDCLVAGRDRDRAEWSQTPSQLHYDALRKDGRALRLSCCLTPVDWAGLAAVQQFVLDHDGCDGNGEICRAEQRFRDYAESAADWFWETDAGLRFTFIEGGFEAILGLPAERILGRTREQLYAELGVALDARVGYLAALQAHRPLRNVEVSWPHPNGSRRVLAISGKPLFDCDGRFSGYRGVGTDITAIKRAEQAEAEAGQRQAELAHVTRRAAVGEMASGLAHELNQPLTAINNCCEAALDVSAGSERGSELDHLLKQIRSQTHRAAEVIRHLRPLVRKTGADFQPVDLKKLIEETLWFINLEGRRRGVSYRLRLAERLPAPLAVRIQVEQVLINLCRNAIEAMARAESRRRELTVSARRDGPDAVRVSVADTGPGLSEPISRLFTPYHTNKPGGLGMGLAISRRIVEAHGGRLWAEPADGGALFHFTLAHDPRKR